MGPIERSLTRGFDITNICPKNIDKGPSYDIFKIEFRYSWTKTRHSRQSGLLQNAILAFA